VNADDLKLLARHADAVHGREPSRLREVHARVRTIRRRRRVAGTLASGVITLAVLLGVLSPRLFAHTPPPVNPPTPATPTPTHTVTPDQPPDAKLFHPRPGTRKLTLRQTVLSWNADQLSGVASPDDPDVRLSIWRTQCVVCPAGEAGHPVFDAMALTRDGYETTTYLHLPTENFDLGPGRLRSDNLDPPSISSPVPGVFLLVEHVNGPAWVLHANGVLRRVHLTAEASRVPDPRLVYSCSYDKGGTYLGWCLLDPRRATSAPLSGTVVDEGHSAGNPGLGQAPWGTYTIRNGPGDMAWWQDHGVRRTQELAVDEGRGYVRSLSGSDDPTYWTARRGARSMEIRVARPRSGGLVSLGRRPFPPVPHRTQPGLTSEDVWDPGFFRTPDGALLAVSHSYFAPGLMVWRASGLTEGAFELVYDGRGGPPWTRLAPAADVIPEVRGGQLRIGLLVSHDDGRTWTDPVTVWR
jgi:hypothetical protein